MKKLFIILLLLIGCGDDPVQMEINSTNKECPCDTDAMIEEPRDCKC